jgi:hypothetical protein
VASAPLEAVEWLSHTLCDSMNVAMFLDSDSLNESQTESEQKSNTLLTSVPLSLPLRSDTVVERAARSSGRPSRCRVENRCRCSLGKWQLCVCVCMNEV